MRNIRGAFRIERVKSPFFPGKGDALLRGENPLRKKQDAAKNRKEGEGGTAGSMDALVEATSSLVKKAFVARKDDGREMALVGI